MGIWSSWAKHCGGSLHRGVICTYKGVGGGLHGDGHLLGTLRYYYRILSSKRPSPCKCPLLLFDDHVVHV